MDVALTYDASLFRRDLVAGLTVAAIAVPQGMAYALLAGVDPRFGLYSAIVVTLVASIFGSSSHLINGPTSAISLVVFSALAVFEPDQRVEAAEAMFALGITVGAIQVAIAVFRLGDLTRYISEAVRDLRARGVDVWLAGLRSDFMDALHRLRFAERFPPERLLAHGAEDYSADARRDPADPHPAPRRRAPAGTRADLSGLKL